MGIARTILALVVAVAVAVLPTAGGAAFKLKSADTVEMTASEPMHDCCPDQAAPCDKSARDCMSMAACAVHSFNFATVSFSSLTLPSGHLDRVPLLASAALRSHAVGPPFRPPRS